MAKKNVEQQENRITMSLTDFTKNLQKNRIKSPKSTVKDDQPIISADSLEEYSSIEELFDKFSTLNIKDKKVKLRLAKNSAQNAVGPKFSQSVTPKSEILQTSPQQNQLLNKSSSHFQNDFARPIKSEKLNMPKFSDSLRKIAMSDTKLSQKHDAQEKKQIHNKKSTNHKNKSHKPSYLTSNLHMNFGSKSQGAQDGSNKNPCKFLIFKQKQDVNTKKFSNKKSSTLENNQYQKFGLQQKKKGIDHNQSDREKNLDFEGSSSYSEKSQSYFADEEKNFSEDAEVTFECNLCCEEKNDSEKYKYVCGHFICVLCACRLINLCSDKVCPTCRKETAPTETHPAFEQYSQIKCTKCPKFFKNPLALISHYVSIHGLHCCELCVLERKIFPFEWDLYDKRLKLDIHKKRGLFLENEIGFYGHYFCAFCRTHHFDQKSFISHLRVKHSLCTVCESAGRRNIFFKNEDLKVHHKIDHYTCSFPQCEGVVFLYSTELFEHNIKYHRIAGKPTISPHTNQSKINYIDVSSVHDSLLKKASQRLEILQKIQRLFQKSKKTSDITFQDGLEFHVDSTQTSKSRGIPVGCGDFIADSSQETTLASNHDIEGECPGSMLEENEFFDTLDLSNLKLKYKSLYEDFKNDYPDQAKIIEREAKVNSKTPDEDIKKQFLPFISNSASLKVNKPILTDNKNRNSMQKVVVVKVENNIAHQATPKVLFCNKNLLHNETPFSIQKGDQNSSFAYAKRLIESEFKEHKDEIIGNFIAFTQKQIPVEDLYQNLENLIGGKRVLHLIQNVKDRFDAETRQSLSVFHKKYEESVKFPTVKISLDKKEPQKPKKIVGFKIIDASKKKK